MTRYDQKSNGARLPGRSGLYVYTTTTIRLNRVGEAAGAKSWSVASICCGEKSLDNKHNVVFETPHFYI